MYAAMLLFGSGLLWAPFAARQTYCEASRRGLAPRRYAVLGGAYSILCIFLWLNLMSGIREGNWNRYKTPPLYFALFLIWLGLILMALLHIAMAYLGFYEFDDDYSRPTSPWTFATIGILALMVVALSVSARRFWERRTSILANDGPSVPLDGLMPFGLALVSAVATIVHVIGNDAPDGFLPGMGN